MTRFSLVRRKNKSDYQRMVSCDNFESIRIPNKGPIYCSDKRCREISKVFLPTEEWAKNDWYRIYPQLSKDELSYLDADVVVRTIRSSEYLAQPERRAKRNLEMLRQRVKWHKKYNVQDILRLCEGTEISKLSLKAYPTPDRIEQFRNLVLPMKMFGFSSTGVPIVKLSYNESNWSEATKIFKDKAELKILMILTLESLKKKLQLAKCRAEAADNSVFVLGRFILVCDVTGLVMRSIKSGYHLNIFKIVPFIYKYYPDLVLKTYVVHNRHFSRGSRLLYPFVASRIIRKISFFSNEKEVVKQLVTADGFELGQLPVEFGGTFEGSYLVNVSFD